MKATVIEVIEESPLVKTLKLKLESSITFEPGQFITIIYKIDEKLVRRAYSISHWTEQPTDTITITLNQAPHGTISPKLYNAEQNEVLELEGPFGNFKIDKKTTPILFLAAGTGVAPLNAMIESENNRQLTLIYSTKEENLILFKNKLENTANLTFIPTLTDNIPENWPGKTGRINKDLIQEHLKSNSEIYICGMQEFVKTMMGYLQELNIQKDQIHTERW